MLDIDHCLFQPSLSSFQDRSEEIDSENSRQKIGDRREEWQKLESTFDLLPGIPVIKLGYDPSR